MNDTYKFASFLSEFRKKNKTITTTQVEALLLVASGVDNMSDLTSVMLDEKGRELSTSTISRVINYLIGRGRYEGGKWIESNCEALLQRRNHPHRQGYQLALTSEGKSLIQSYFDTYDEKGSCSPQVHE
tara:strand:+ start:33 stop:419 length:387 start_codon:yes stop_codon:yes gene_type:complete